MYDAGGNVIGSKTFYKQFDNLFGKWETALYATLNLRDKSEVISHSTFYR